MKSKIDTTKTAGEMTQDVRIAQERIRAIRFGSTGSHTRNTRETRTTRRNVARMLTELAVLAKPTKTV